ncbi:non-ribosomal peptide synthetase [Ruegeria arenilitoris]|uniref:non-ribosomal peptide synthetase n=1 Tax=Ruegeria arenilitoris TaxID=1173585 RepID=UPI0014817224|nr:non-ribosomal peptide synthetase [Ruegeria arenilitoris]
MGHPKGIADILPLTPSQKGMLFHVVDPDSVPGAYVAVVSCTLEGPLNAERLRSAMQKVLDARDALRTGFVWEGIKQPVQIVKENSALPWRQLDWRGFDDTDTRLRDLVRLEQTRRFDLKSPPLMAATLIRVTDTSWRLLWTVHHLISDGWSTQIALRGTLENYNGIPHSRTQPPGFKNYLSWLNKHPNLTDTSFWTEQFKGLEEPCLLPQSDASQSGLVQECKSVFLGDDLLTQVNNVARKLKVTSNTVLSASWALVMRHLLQQDDVIFGTTTAGRPVDIPGISEAVGPFINTLPARVKIDPWQTVETLLQSHAKAEIARREHEFASLAEVQACAPFPAGTALFDTLFVNEGVAQENFDVGDIRLSNLRTVQHSSYPLALLVTPNGQFRAEVYFDPNRLSVGVDELLSWYEHVLSEMVRDPKLRIREIFRSRQVPEIVPYDPNYQDVVQRILSHAKAEPNAAAVSDEKGTLTYSELSFRSRQIAWALKQSGVGPSDIVPVAVSRGFEAIAAFIGIMMTGAAYVPLDMNYPTRRISQILEATSPRFIVTSSTCLENLPPNTASIILFDGLDTAIDDTESVIGQRAYVMFTSGSQNRPKGVEITRNALAISTSAREAVYRAPPESYLLLSSLAFDSSVAGIYWTLSTGGHLVIAPHRVEQNPTNLGKLIRHHRITHTLCLPSLAQALLSTVERRSLHSLRVLIAAGEAVPAALVAQCKSVLPDCRIVNEYGPTEATVWCTSYDTTEWNGEDNVPIGTAIPGTWVGIVDQDDNTIPEGKVGEIVVAGSTVAKGYLDDPAQTQDRFFALGPDEIPAYRTGDLGIADSSGSITFLGRKDKQVKIRGHRIELSEIETVARSVATETRMAALVLDYGGVQAISVAVECPDGDPLCNQVKQTIEETLPAQFHPRSVRGVASFPNLPNGKLDERALAELLENWSEVPSGAPSQDDLERKIADLFSEILKVPYPARDANFFDLGGDSLITLKTAAEAKERGITFEPMDLFSFPTVAELANRVRVADAGRPSQEKWKVYHAANQGGDKTPVALVHCLMPFFKHVAENLGPDHTVVHMPGHRLPRMPVPFDKSLEDLADEAIATLKDVTPDKPIVLCGFSAGCALVLAVLKQLGPDKVAGLVLLDPPYKMIGAEPSLQPLYYRTYKRWRYMFRRAKHARKAIKSVPQAKALMASENWTEEQRIEAVSLAYGLAINDFEVPRFDGKTHVFLTPGNPAMTKGDVLDTHLTNKTLHRVETKHRQLLRLPDSQALISACIKSVIDENT